jgi:hypothetical protein
VTNGIAATTANPYYFNDSALLGIIDEFKHSPTPSCGLSAFFETDFRDFDFENLRFSFNG